MGWTLNPQIGQNVHRNIDQEIQDDLGEDTGIDEVMNLLKFYDIHWIKLAPNGQDRRILEEALLQQWAHSGSKDDDDDANGNDYDDGGGDDEVLYKFHILDHCLPTPASAIRLLGGGGKRFPFQRGPLHVRNSCE